MGITASVIIKCALSYVGITEDPPGSNNVIFNTAYYNRVINHPDYHWCVVGVWYTFKECGAADLFFDGGKTASCASLWDWAKKNKLTVKTPARGDLVLFDWDGNGKANHVGIIKEVYADGSLDTVEFNVDDAVKEMHRTNKAQFIAFIRPKYDPEVKVPASCDADTCPILRYMRDIIKDQEGSIKE